MSEAVSPKRVLLRRTLFFNFSFDLRLLTYDLKNEHKKTTH